MTKLPREVRKYTHPKHWFRENLPKKWHNSQKKKLQRLAAVLSEFPDARDEIGAQRL